MAEVTIRIEGLRELNSALHRYDRDLGKGLDRKLREAGGIVARDATTRLSQFDSATSSFAAQLRGYGLLVVKRRRSKHRRGDFGALLMVRSLLPAVRQEEPRFVEAISGMLTDLARENGF